MLDALPKEEAASLPPISFILQVSAFPVLTPQLPSASSGLLLPSEGRPPPASVTPGVLVRRRDNSPPRVSFASSCDALPLPPLLIPSLILPGE